ncbi:MAG: glycosyltransferase [Chloroflexi bacterium]|nr:glycosyltransferase [Chloroflexota bacterium]
MKIAVIIPALNEAESIGALVAETLAQPVDKVIVVDNGSTDHTAQKAREAGAEVVSEARRGYGYACAAGAAAAGEAEVLIFLDGDYSCLPNEIPALLAPLGEDRADLVIGSRELGHIAPGAMPLHQRFGNWLIARLMNTLYGLLLTDLGPYRAIKRELVEAMAMREMTYGWTTEMTVKAARRRARIVEVPVSWLPRRGGHSKIGGSVKGAMLATYYVLGVTLRYAY